MKVIQTVLGIVYDKVKGKDRFLILKKQGDWEGWQFVQGGKEKDEDFETAVKREVLEETGLSAESVQRLSDIKSDYFYREADETVHKLVHFYLVKADSKKKVKISIEHSDSKWVDSKKASAMVKYNKKEFEQALSEMKKLLSQKTLGEF